MTLEQLRIFVAVAERQHVTRAAEALNLSQSAVSSAIAALEDRQNVSLFDRVGRGIALTEAGRLFLAEARAVLARAEAAELVLAELGGLKRGTLRVQASQTIAGFWLPRHLAAFRKAHPGIEIQLGIGNTAQVAAAVHADTAELGFVEGTVQDTLLQSRVVAQDQLLILVGPEHPWAGRKHLAPAELTETDWVLREPGSGTRSEFERALARFGIAVTDLKVALEVPSNEAVRAAVEAGLGATALSASVAAASVEAGLLMGVPFALPARSFYVLRHRERTPSKAAETLVAMIVRHQRKGKPQITPS
jgi:DNA-binding transcriptional LysR family regulator